MCKRLLQNLNFINILNQYYFLLFEIDFIFLVTPLLRHLFLFDLQQMQESDSELRNKMRAIKFRECLGKIASERVKLM